jgi:hypothetical protein
MKKTAYFVNVRSRGNLVVRKGAALDAGPWRRNRSPAPAMTVGRAFDQKTQRSRSPERADVIATPHTRRPGHTPTLDRASGLRHGAVMVAELGRRPVPPGAVEYQRRATPVLGRIWGEGLGIAARPGHSTPPPLWGMSRTARKRPSGGGANPYLSPAASVLVEAPPSLTPPTRRAFTPVFDGLMGGGDAPPARRDRNDLASHRCRP